MTLPTTMHGLVQLHDGNSTELSGQTIETLEPYVAYRELPVPEPGPGQALIKVARAAVNPSDVAFIKGLYGQPRQRGVPAGFEGTGTVVAGDTPFVGQRVSFFGGLSGTWADYALADASGLIPLRPDLFDDDAAGLIVNPLTASAMFDLVKEDGAESFVVTAAASQLGKFLIALGKDAGVPAIAIIRRGEAATHLKELGAGEVLVTSDPGFAGARATALKTLKPRVMLDAVGDQISADTFFAMGPRARWVSYGRLSLTPPQLTQMAHFIFMEKKIEGFWLTSWFRDNPPDRAAAVVAEVQERFATGHWVTDITEVVPLSQTMERLPAAYGAKDGKVLIAPGS